MICTAKTKIKKRKINAKEISKQTNSLLVLAAILFIFLFFLGFLYTKKYSIFEYKAPVKTQFMVDVECLKLGNVCSNKDILNGIKVKIPVSPEEAYDFYLISNTDTEATYMMADDFIHVDWHDEMINFKGPQKALYELNVATRTWSHVPIIENYSYEDFGYLTYTGVCDEKTIIMQDYDCKKTPGYQILKINHGKGSIIYHIPPLASNDPEITGMEDTWDFEGTTFRARLITLEEIGPLGDANGLATWLVDHSKNGDSYWTMTSNATPGSNYILEAHTITNQSGKPSVESHLVHNANISIRPVITIPKN